MLVIWLTFLGELEDDEKNLLYVAVSRAKKSLRLSQKIVNLIHLQKVLSLITMLSCYFLVVCFLSKCTTYFQKRRSTQVRVQNFLPLRSVFESFNSSLKHQRAIIPETMAKWLWNVVIPLEIRNLFFVVANFRFCPSTCTRSREGRFQLLPDSGEYFKGPFCSNTGEQKGNLEKNYPFSSKNECLWRSLFGTAEVK